ncbi:MAG: hypothetical protein NZM02_01120, partial [Patescibacteria group bacterium]|nr:hypothetical protein [Patescibacteria group bacterium]
ASFLTLLLLDYLLYPKPLTFYSPFDKDLPPIKINVPYNGPVLGYFDDFLGGKLSAILTDYSKIIPRLEDRLKQDFQGSPDQLISDFKLFNASKFDIFHFPIPLLSSSDGFKLLITKKDASFSILKPEKKDNDQVCFAAMPQDILQKTPEIKAAISIGATNPYFISYDPNGVFCNVPKDFFRNQKEYTFSFAPYSLLNFVGRLHNKQEIELFNQVQRKSPLIEYRHGYLIKIPNTDIFYQPQYSISRKDGEFYFCGSNHFHHKWDQTINLFGFLQDGRKIFLSGPWYFNQPENRWVIDLVEIIFSKIGFKKNDFILVSADTGGQTGFYYKEDKNFLFSHSENFNHTTCIMLGLT